LNPELSASLQLDPATGRIASWTDTVGGVTLRAGALGPLLVKGGINSHHFVTFNSSSDSLGTNSGAPLLPTGANAREVYAVVRYNSGGRGGFAWGGSSGALSCGSIFGLGVNKDNLYVEDGCSTPNIKSSTRGKGAGWMIHSASISKSTITHSKNGEMLSSVGYKVTTGTGNQQIQLGTSFDGTTNLDLDVAEIILYARALDAAESAALVTYLLAKYNVKA
jgi:hypothetical protein